MFSPKEPTLVVSSGAIASLLHVSPMDEQRPPSHLHGMAQGSAFSGDLLALEPPTAEIQGAGHDEQSMLQYPRSSQDGITLQRSAGISAIAAGINDWASQGIDMAFFNSLMKGTSCVDAAGSEQLVG